MPEALSSSEQPRIVWDSSNEETQLLEINQWIVDQGLPEGEFYMEHTDPNTGDPLLTLDLAWPEGIEIGLSQPAAILLNEDSETEDAANQAGYRFFTDIASFRQYVNWKSSPQLPPIDRRQVEGSQRSANMTEGKA